MKDSGFVFVSWRDNYDGCSQGGFAILGLHRFYKNLSLVFNSYFSKYKSNVHLKALLTGLFSWSGNYDGCC